MVLAHRVGIYVSRPELVAEVARALAERYGGATAVPARGFWVAEDGRLVEDPTTLVYSNCSEPPSIEELQSWAQELAKAWREEAVAVERDGVLILGYAAEAVA